MRMRKKTGYLLLMLLLLLVPVAVWADKTTVDDQAGLFFTGGRTGTYRSDRGTYDRLEHGFCGSDDRRCGRQDLRGVCG